MNPISKVSVWLDEARKSEKNDPDAISLATVDSDGLPNIRTVLLRKLYSDSFVFFTNYKSAKAKEIKENGKVAFSFHWKSLARQIRVRGIATKEDGPIADEYYQGRPLGSRIGAWASKQSSELPNRDVLLERIQSATEKFEENPPRPSFWGGIRIRPLAIEFWEEGEFRLHNREAWTRTDLNSPWKMALLYP